MPITIAFTLIMSLVVSLIYGLNWRNFGAILMTCTMLVLLLGLNVSAIGLVNIPHGSVHLVFELFGLILVLNLVYVLVFIGLERNSLIKKEASFET